MRTRINFNKDWYFTKEELVYEDAVKKISGMEQLNLPHTWNAVDGQDGGNDYHRGTCTYLKKFMTPDMADGNRVVLEFLGVAMTAEVYVNGKQLKKYEGGYSTFRVDITDVLEGKNKENILCVLVDNSINDRVYPQKADFTFYGGIYREVNLLILSESHFEVLKDGTFGIKVTPVIEKDKAVVTIESWQNTDDNVRFTIYEPKGSGTEYWRNIRKQNLQTEEYTECIHQIETESKNGKAEAELFIEHVRVWNGKADPYLYMVKAELLNESGEILDEVMLRFGCRSFYMDKNEGFFLNGEKYPLRGVSRHQDRAGVGNALTEKMHEEDLDMILEIGASTVRLAHYQHAQYFYDLCDEAGLVVWAEIPYITQHMPNGRENTIQQMRELITQTYHHPSIICWGLSNEISAAGAVTEDLMENHRQLQELCHRLDQTRPTVMAHAFMLETESPLIEIADMASYNLYYGWYLGELEENEAFFDEYHKKFPDRIMGFSEYGADANPQYQSAAPERGDYSESYQNKYHEHLIRCINARPYLWATHVWNMFDFAADGRDEGGKHGENQKGLVTMDRKIKKDSFYLYKAYWSTDPFIHICGRRYVNRAEEETEIKIYSNQNEIALYVDGRLAEVKQGDKIFTFYIKLSGEHTVEARCENSTVMDKICIRKVKEEDKTYQMVKKEAVVNWFDKEQLDPTCFSIQDKMGDIMKHPEGAALIERMMAKARASRGEVAEAASNNPVLQKMLSKMSIQSILKQAGDTISVEEIKGLNTALQMLKKPTE